MMRTRILLLLALALAAASLPAAAHGGGKARVSVGFVFGAPAYWYYPGYYYPPYYPYYPQPVAVQAEPTVYIERGDAGAPAEQSQGSQGYWYYCKESKAYHPYVKHCPGGWEKQVPTPAPGG